MVQFGRVRDYDFAVSWCCCVRANAVSSEGRWTGAPAIFFRIVLSDNACRNHLRQTSQRVAATVFQKVKPVELGLQPYFNFRSVSEQADLQEEAWA
jgi:hypothetical protein